MRIETSFVNELGNRIKITIEGPTSVSENVLTQIEADHLHEVLNEYRDAAYWKGAYGRMAARNKDLDAALIEIRDRHIPDQPTAYGGSEYEWAVRQYRELRSIATAAIASHKAGG